MNGFDIRGSEKELGRAMGERYEAARKFVGDVDGVEAAIIRERRGLGDGAGEEDGLDAGAAYGKAVRQAVNRRFAERMRDQSEEEILAQGTSRSRRDASFARKAEYIRSSFDVSWLFFLRDRLGMEFVDVDGRLNRQLVEATPFEVFCDMAQGRVTSRPLLFRVAPKVWDGGRRALVQGSPVTAMSFFRFRFPYAKMPDGSGYRPARIDDRHLPYVASYPCYPLRDKREPAFPVRGGGERRESPRFSAGDIKALENIGVRGDRLFGGHFGSLTVAEKERIDSGEAFPFVGALRVDVGAGKDAMICVAGEGRLKRGADGVAAFIRSYTYADCRPSASRCVDLEAMRRVGGVEYDFYERDGDGKVVKDASGRPMLNEAGEELRDYGIALRPVRGFYCEKAWDEGERRYRDVFTVKMYSVSVVGGAVVGTPMLKTGRGWVVADAKMGGDGSVLVSGERLSFVSERDRDGFLRGYGGLVRGAKGGGGAERYDAFVVADNRRNGFAHAFGRKDTARILRRGGRRAGCGVMKGGMSAG